MYTSDEVQSAVQKLVRSAIRRPVDTLGVRRTDVAFSDVQEAAAGVFLLYPQAPYYVISLGAQRLLDVITAELATCDVLVAAIAAAGRSVLPVDDVSPLFDATAALGELESAASRGQVFRDVTSVPAFQRFDASLGRFLAQAAANLREDGDIVATPQDARAAVPSLLKAIEEQHANVLERVRLLSGALADFTALNLPALVAQGVISRSREVLAAHARDLETLTPEQRLVSLRATTLDVLAARAIVRGFSSFAGPSSVRAMAGTATPFADATHLATPAAVVSDTANSFVLLPGGNSLELAVDGGAPGLITLPLSPVAVLEGSLAEGAMEGSTTKGFLINDDSDPALPANNEVRVAVDDVVHAIPLNVTLGDLRTAQQICDELNAGLPPLVRAEPYFAPLKYIGALDITAGGTSTFSVPGGMSNLVLLTVAVGDVVVVKDGPNAGAFQTTAVTPTSVTVVRTSGAFVAAAGTLCEIGPALRRVRIRCTDPATQVPARTKITVLGDTAKSREACFTLGFFPGLSSQCRPSTVDDILLGLRSRALPVVASSRQDVVTEGPASGDPLNALRVIFAMPVTAVENQAVVVDSGPNAGTYLVAADGPGPNDVTLKTGLPFVGVAEAVTFPAKLVDLRLVLRSKSQTTASALSVNGNAASVFFTTVPHVGRGTSRWLRLPQSPRAVEAGDLLELFDTHYRVPTRVSTVLNVEVGPKLIEVLPELPGNEPLDFADKTPPFARLRSGKSYDYDLLRARLETFLTREENQPAFFVNVRPHVNAVVTNRNPTAVQLGDAQASVTQLRVALLNGMTALRSYETAPDAAVDALLRTFREKGSDRAVDLLLRGEFRTFFGLSADAASYAGAAQEAMREVAREDVPVRKTGRAEATHSQELAAAESPDFEFDQSDVETVERPDFGVLGD